MPIPTVDPQPPALAGLHFFGMVQYIGAERTADWVRVLLARSSASRAARRAALRHPAQGPHAAEPVPQLLPAADRARARHRSTSSARSTCSASASARPTCWPPWRRCARAASSSSNPSSVHFERARRADRAAAGRRDVRAGARRTRVRRGGHEQPRATSTTSAWTPHRWPARWRPSWRRCASAGFSQVMLGARDIVGHPGGHRGRRAGGARQRAARHRFPGAARLRGPARPPARLQGRHRQVDARDVRRRSAARVLLVVRVDLDARQHRPRCDRARPAQARDAGDAAGHQGGLRGPVVGPHASTSSPPPGTWCCRADCPNLGLGIDSFHVFAAETPLDDLDADRPGARSSSCSWPTSCGRRSRSVEERIATARNFRVFPGEGVHSEQLAELVTAAGRAGLPRRLQLRGLQRRLPADAAADRGAARARARPCGWARTCCAARCRCPNRMRLRKASGFG